MDWLQINTARYKFHVIFLHFIHLLVILEKQICTRYNRTYHIMEFIIMRCVKNRPIYPNITREVIDKDDQTKLFPNFVQNSRPMHSIYHVYERLTLIEMQSLLIHNFEVGIRHGISEVTCKKFWERWNWGCESVRPRLWIQWTTSLQHDQGYHKLTWYFLVHDKTHTDVGTTF
jgi:hypothetical protein